MRQKDKKTKQSGTKVNWTYPIRVDVHVSTVSKGQLFLFSKINVIQVITFIQDIAQTL